ncbi:hypothetical protein SVAN01_02570 [Stagonosporopsis vannaccii]|nr:hypothetical protein SVAN01_02570 [Stagonosporopsis vannaccii]
MLDHISRPPFDPAYKGAGGVPDPSKTLDIPTLRQTLQASSPDASSIAIAHPQYAHTELSCPGLNDPSNSAQPTDPPVTLSLWQLPPSTPALRTWSRGRPLVYYVHGGGQIAGNRFLGPEYAISHFSPADNVIFASPEYRLAPEHASPAGARDVYAGLLYLATHAQELGIDPAKIVVYGVSGGAAVAAGAALLSRKVGGPRGCALVLDIPMLDDRRADEYPSTSQFWDGTMWPGWMDVAAWKLVLGEEKGDADKDGVRVPGRAGNLADLPPVFIDIGDCESMRDQAVAFASRIWRDGGSAELHVWPGVYHGGAMFEPDVPVSRDMIRAQKAFLRRVLGMDGEVDGLEDTKAANL